MLDNHLYNLVSQMVQENKSLWRIKSMYAKDAKKCKHCQALWKKMRTQKESNVALLTRLMKQHMK